MVPQMAPNYFRSFSRRLQHWIRGRTPRPPSATCPSGTLHHQHILGGDLILSSWPWLDIQHQALPEQVTFVHERVYWFFPFWNTDIPNQRTPNSLRTNTARLNMNPRNNLDMRTATSLILMPQVSKVSNQSLERYCIMHATLTTRY